MNVFSLLLIAFPTYSGFLFNDDSSVLLQYQEKNKRIELAVSGMTCTSCELEIEAEVIKLDGVSFVKASYENGSTTVEFDEQKIKPDKIIEAINATGYPVDQSSDKITLQDQPGNCCSNGTCKVHLNALPKDENKNLKIVSGVDEIKKTFNQQNGKVKFVAILSSTC